jgi:hypothetical protein
MNRTYIEELPFLEDVVSAEQQVMNGGLSMIPTSESGKIKRFIRNNEYNLPSESGMNTKQQQMIDEQELVQQQKMYEEQQQKMYEEQQRAIEQEEFEFQRSHREEKRRNKKKNQRFHESDCDLNCISVADHAANCIVCSKLYNNDKTLYLAIIGVLIIICIILMKKVVEK